MNPKFRFVCATRTDPEQFWTSTALGQSLAPWRQFGVELRLFPRNSTGLPSVYNTALREAAADPAILLFVHDDIYVCDFYWASNIHAGLRVFDILGLAGNRRRTANQPAWAFIDTKFTWDSANNLSGIVGHGSGFPPSNISVYGSACQEVKLLDGLMLVARSDVLLAKGVHFDERFDFHF